MTNGIEPPSPAERMWAAVQHTAGGPDTLVIEQVPRPEPSLVEVLVRVHATSVNPTDCKTRARGRFATGETVPLILGYDVSGVVEAVGPGVTIWQPGDEVFGMPRFPHPAGAYAQYVTAPARHFAPKPTALDHEHAAALPLAGLTAWQALVDTAHLSAGQRVLIHAGAGGVGHLAVQIAAARGAEVIATAGRGKAEFVASLGANRVIDYTTVDFRDEISGVDVVLDPIGGDVSGRSLDVLGPGGTLVCLLPSDPGFPGEQAARLGIRAVRMLVEPDAAGLAALSGLVRAGALRPHVGRSVPLAQVPDAHAAVDAGHSVGKTVITLP